MSVPTFTFEVAFTPTTPYDLAPAFTNLAADLTSLSVTRGRQSEDDTAATGTCVGSLLDTERAYDPNNASGPYYPNVLPVRPMRVVATLDAVPYAVFYGWVDLNDGWVRDEQDVGAAVVTVPANDGFEPLGIGRVFFNQYSVQVLALAPLLYWRLDEAPGTATAADSSGNGHTGTYTRPQLGQVGALVGDSDTAVLLPGGSGSLPATNGFVSSTYSPFAAGSSRTFVQWVKRGSAGQNNDYIEDTLGAVALSNDINGNVTWATGGGSTTWTNALQNAPAGAWMHVALTYNDTTHVAELFINGVSAGAQTVTGGYSGTGNFGIGYISNVVTGSTYQDEVAIFGSILTAAQIASLYAFGSPTAGANFASETTGARIGHALDKADPPWPTAWRTLDAGQETILAYAASSSVTPLGIVRDAELTEPGFFFFARNGYATFHDRRHRVTATSAATFCDKSNFSGGRVLYDSITTRRTTVANDVRVTPSGGTEQLTSDTPSIDSFFFRRVWTATTQHLSDAAALAFGQFVLSLKKDTYELIESLTLVPGTDSATWAQVLGREVGDRITVVRTPPGGGSAITQDYFIEAVSLDWGPGPTSKCVWRLSASGAQFNYWLAGTVGSSEAGTTTKAAY